MMHCGGQARPIVRPRRDEEAGTKERGGVLARSSELVMSNSLAGRPDDAFA